MARSSGRAGRTAAWLGVRVCVSFARGGAATGVDDASELYEGSRDSCRDVDAMGVWPKFASRVSAVAHFHLWVRSTHKRRDERLRLGVYILSRAHPPDALAGEHYT